MCAQELVGKAAAHCLDALRKREDVHSSSADPVLGLSSYWIPDGVLTAGGELYARRIRKRSRISICRLLRSDFRFGRFARLAQPAPLAPTRRFDPVE